MKKTSDKKASNSCDGSMYETASDEFFFSLKSVNRPFVFKRVTTRPQKYLAQICICAANECNAKNE